MTIQNGLIREMLGQIIKPLFGFSHTIGFVKEVNRIPQKISLGVFDIIAILFIFVRHLGIGLVHSRYQVQVWAKSIGSTYGIKENAPMLKGLVDGLIDDATQRNQIILFHFVWIFLGQVQTLRAPIDCVSFRQAPVKGPILVIDS